MTRLVTFVDIDNPSADTESVSARHEVELADGTRVLLLDDRGWGGSAPWAATSIEEVQETARMVVGPDEPPDGRSYENEEAAHWSYLQQIAQRQGIATDMLELQQLPHDVVLSQRLLARIGSSPSARSS